MANPNSREPVFLEGVQIMWRNFRGEGSDFNAEGKRNFCIILEEDVAEALELGGWNVKRTKPQEDGSQTAFLPVEASYKGRKPPEVVLIDKRMTPLNEDTVAMADGVEIEFCDVFIRPYDWKKGRDSGRKAYLMGIAITLARNPIHEKYAHLEEESDTTVVQQLALESKENQTPPPSDDEDDIPDAEIVPDDADEEPPY